VEDKFEELLDLSFQKKVFRRPICQLSVELSDSAIPKFKYWIDEYKRELRHLEDDYSGCSGGDE
jgi:hypothetical protein